MEVEQDIWQDNDSVTSSHFNESDVISSDYESEDEEDEENNKRRRKNRDGSSKSSFFKQYDSL